MSALDVIFIVGALAGLAAFVWLWRRFPRRRVHLLVGAVLLAGVAVFTAWWTLFRVDDPTFAADQAKARQSQEALDDALGKDF